MSILPGLQWTADVDVLVGQQIVEIYMNRAGMTVIRQDKLLPIDLIHYLEELPKLASSVMIGKISKEKTYGDLSNKITNGIRVRMEALLQENNVDPNNILSVKRDAVYLIGQPPRKLVLQDGTKFSMKAAYSAYARLGTVELYGNPKRKTADLKGIPQENRHLHMNFIVRVVLDYLGMIAQNQIQEAADTLCQFREDYVKRILPIGFYRELNAVSSLTVKMGDCVYQFIGEGDSDLDINQLEIGYNIRNVIMPLARAIA